MIQTVLAIETSCDDTSVAVVADGGWVRSVVSANQDLAHSPFGGIVPEIAGRNHSVNTLPLVDQALKSANHVWDQIDGIVVTNRPGLIGSLIVGLVTAKSLAQVRGLPLIGVNHLEGHIMAPLLKDPNYQPPNDFDFPFLALVVSGGHTTIYLASSFGKYEVLGGTRDDAAGEAFDKFAKALGLGWPGGVKVDQLSKGGNSKAFDFPRGMIKEDNFDMSFSGLKASGMRLIGSLNAAEVAEKMSDLCASYQEAIVEVLLAKLEKAVQKTGIRHAVITGGVSANSRLRERAEQWSVQKKVQLVVPPLRYCTDNAAMVGFAGLLRLQNGERSELSLGPAPSSLAGDFQGMDL